LAEIFGISIFHCQQAIEKLLKAMWIERADLGSPPKTHSLNELVQGLGLQVSAERKEFLQTLTNQYVPTRYADFEVEYQVDQVQWYLDTTTEVVEWLRQQLS